MGKRFKNLNAALGYLKTDDDATNPDAPAGTPLKLYQDWKSGKRNVKYDRKADSKAEEILIATLNPFGLPIDAANVVKTGVSKRANGNDAIKDIKAKANYSTDTTGVGVELKDFVPAKATIFIPSGNVPTTPTKSKLTGKDYFPQGGASYTIPYGSSATKGREGEVRAEMLAAIPNASKNSISFTSEKL